MNNDFLDSKNFTYLINFVRNDVKQKSDYDIFTNKKYINIFKKLIQTIHNTNMNKNVTKEYLNTVVIDKCVPFLIEQINNNKKKDRLFDLETPQIETMTRPKSTRIVKKKKKVLSQNDFSNLTLENDIESFNNQNLRDTFLDNRNNSKPIDNITGISSRDEEKIDIMKKMQELETERNYKQGLNDADKFNKQVEKANEKSIKQMQNINKKNAQNDNEFFKKLYKNNLQNNDLNDANPLEIQNNVNIIENEEKSIDDLMKERSSLYSNNDNNLNMDINNQNNQNTMIPSNLDFGNLNENENSLDSFYENKSMIMAKKELETPVNPLNMNEYLSSREELMPSNINESLDMNINNSTKINSEDITEKLQNITINEEAKKEYQEKTYIATNKVFERRKKRVLTVDISSFLEDIEPNKPAINNYSNNFWNHLKVNFQEKFVIDKISDVFLESITINNPAQANYFNNLYLVIDIDEFNVKTTTNNIFMKDKFVLPNENTATSGSNKLFKYHLKSNYIATINPGTLSSLTFKITNENNETVGLTLEDSGSTINNEAGYKANSDTIVYLNRDNFSVFDAIYNSNKRFIGIISGIDNDNKTLYLNSSTHVPLTNGEKIFVVDNSIRTEVLSSAVADEGSLTVAVDTVDARTEFNIGDKVYLGNGCLLGTLANVAQNLLTFASGISISVPNDVRMYKECSLPRVFASNNRNNRIIMEFMFISR